jgi:hypothetical protein
LHIITNIDLLLLFVFTSIFSLEIIFGGWGEFQVLEIIFGFKVYLHHEICIEIEIKDGIKNKLHDDQILVQKWRYVLKQKMDPNAWTPPSLVWKLARLRRLHSNGILSGTALQCVNRFNNLLPRGS